MRTVGHLPVPPSLEDSGIYFNEVDRTDKFIERKGKLVGTEGSPRGWKIEILEAL